MKGCNKKGGRKSLLGKYRVSYYTFGQKKVCTDAALSSGHGVGAPWTSLEAGMTEK